MKNPFKQAVAKTAQDWRETKQKYKQSRVSATDVAESLKTRKQALHQTFTKQDRNKEGNRGFVVVICVGFCVLLAIVLWSILSTNNFQKAFGDNQGRIDQLIKQKADEDAQLAQLETMDAGVYEQVETKAINSAKELAALQSDWGRVLYETKDAKSVEGAPSNEFMPIINQKKAGAKFFKESAFLANEKAVNTINTTAPFDPQTQIDPRWPWYNPSQNKPDAVEPNWSWQLASLTPILDNNNPNNDLSFKAVWVCVGPDNEILAWANSIWVGNDQDGGFINLVVQHADRTEN